MDSDNSIADLRAKHTDCYGRSVASAIYSGVCTKSTPEQVCKGLATIWPPIKNIPSQRVAEDLMTELKVAFANASQKRRIA